MIHKLDALVAERVMGWVVSNECGKHWMVPLECPFFREWDKATWPHCPAFSTNIADAWEVRATLKSKGFEVTIGTHGGLGNISDDTCIIRGDEYDRWDASADNAELAICLAALRAVGVSKAEIEEAMR